MTWRSERHRQRPDLGSVGGDLDGALVAGKQPKVFSPLMPMPDQSSAPDRISLWPVEDGRYGVDATYHGATGYVRAEAQRGALQRAKLRVSLRQDLGDTWTLRLGPLTRSAAWVAIEEFIGPRGRDSGE